MATHKPRRQAFEVFLDAPELGPIQKVGTLFRHEIRTDLPASFEYDKDWLHGDRVFMLDPRLELWTGPQYPPAGATAFGIFMDSAPDRWGRVLMERRESVRALHEGRKARTLRELDFLLGVNDLTRTGALRFRDMEGGSFLDASENAAPPFANLRELADVSRRIESADSESMPEYEQWLAMLMAPGTSLGGARPKANFTDEDGRLWLAKFPAQEDRYDVGAWEFLVNQLARRAGIRVPDARLEELSARHRTYCAGRFDRIGNGRRMFASAMTLLERRDGDKESSYLDLAQFVSENGAADRIEEELEQLFRRVVFNVLVGNRDDHLRNHAFIREPSGWRLSPAYDVNPVPAKSEHALRLDESTAVPNLDTALSTSEYYRIESSRAKKIMEEVKGEVATWRTEANHLGLARSEIELVGRAFGIGYSGAPE
ncbi:MAG TPA: HipA domain-containing protein [Fibrobacteria bacterium]|nr:HipA domain-containing protein [Fibrobacteria bacterium]